MSTPKGIDRRQALRRVGAFGEMLPDTASWAWSTTRPAPEAGEQALIDAHVTVDPSP